MEVYNFSRGTANKVTDCNKYKKSVLPLSSKKGYLPKLSRHSFTTMGIYQEGGSIVSQVGHLQDL